MSYWSKDDSKLPSSIKELEEALDKVMDKIEAGIHETEIEDLWPGFMRRLFKRVEDEAYIAEGVTREVKDSMRKMNALIEELTEQRDAALAANKAMTPLIDELQQKDGDMIMWFISVLRNDKGDERGFRLRRVLIYLAKLKQKLDNWF